MKTVLSACGNLCRYTFLPLILCLVCVSAATPADESSQVGTAPSPAAVTSTGDYDVELANPALLYAESSPTGYFTKFVLSGGVILGHEIFRGNDRGCDIFGMVSDGSVVWTTQGNTRFSGSSEVTRVGNLAPNHTYTFVNGWGTTGTGSRYLTTYAGQWYESFFDGSADNWYDDGTGNWSIGYASDPGNYIDNRCYEMTADETGYYVSHYNYGYAASIGFSFNVDVRRLNEWYNIGIWFLDDGDVNQNGYNFAISGNEYSLWRIVDGVAVDLITWTEDEHIHTGTMKWNNLKVETEDGTIDLYINGAFVDSYFDDTHTYGDIAVGGYVEESATLQFDNATAHRDVNVLGVPPAEPPLFENGDQSGPALR